MHIVLEIKANSKCDIYVLPLHIVVSKVKHFCLHQVPQMLNRLEPPAPVKLPQPPSQGSPGHLFLI